MFFAATDNLAICGYRYEMVGFETRAKRNEFIKHTNFHAISAKEAANFENEKYCRMYPDTVYNNVDSKLQAIVMFTYGGDYVETTRF